MNTATWPYAFIKPFKSSKELVDHLVYGYAPQHVTETVWLGTRSTLFRGQSVPTWPLIPSAHRGGVGSRTPIHDASPQVLPKGFRAGDWKSRRDFTGSFVFEEIAAVSRFLLTADRLGLATPVNYEHFKEQARVYKCLWEQGTRAPYSTPFPDPDLYPAFALAQHHGVPTRFLDWSESPLVAAYFAAHGAWSRTINGLESQSELIAIICLSLGVWMGKQRDVVVVQAPRAGNHFLRQQKGVFTVAPYANFFLLQNDRWPTFQDMIPCSALTCLTLPSTEAEGLLRLLHNLGLTPYDLMPTLDNAARAVAYKKALFK